jgi:hypothetical protein
LKGYNLTLLTKSLWIMDANFLSDAEHPKPHRATSGGMGAAASLRADFPPLYNANCALGQGSKGKQDIARTRDAQARVTREPKRQRFKRLF